MFWMTTLLGMVVMDSLDFFSEPIAKPTLTTIQSAIQSTPTLTCGSRKSTGCTPYWTMASQIFRPANIHSTSSEPLRGSDTADRLIGHDRTDRLHGDAGNDSLIGHHDKDSSPSGQGDATLIGGMGDDSLSGGQGNDQLSGGMGNDTLSSGLGQDVSFSDGGDDRIDGTQSVQDATEDTAVDKQVSRTRERVTTHCWPEQASL